jgi:hypothetical protein
MKPSFHPGEPMYFVISADCETLRHRLIEHRAYDRWVAKGRPPGTALADWLEAEQEVEHELDRKRWSDLCNSLSLDEITST